MVFIEIFKSICVFVDFIIYELIVALYVLFSAMCEMNVDSIGLKFVDLTDRIKVFLGIIMLFIVAFSLLQAIVDPDKGEKATSELVKKIGISIVLLISIQFVFNLFNELQTLVIKNNIIEKIILGNSSESVEPKDEREEQLWIKNHSADNNTELTGYEKYVANGKFFSYNLFFAFINVPEDMKKDVMGDIDQTTGKIIAPEKTLYSIVTDINEEGIYYRYPIISGAVGIFMGVMFFTYAVDIGVRAFSLMILQVIAPIPIIGYIAPGGDKMLNTYFKEYMSAFIELFVKIATIYITLYLMQYCIQAILIDSGGSVTEATTSMFPSMGTATLFFRTLLLVTVFVALFYFSKKFPKLLGSLFGLKFESSINPMKAAGKIIGMGTKLGLGAAGLVGGGILATGAAIGTGAGVGGVLKAGLNGAGQGAQNGFKSKNIGDAIKNSFKQNGEIIKKGREFGYNLGDQGGAAGVRAKKANAANERAIAGAKANLDVINKGEELRKGMRDAAEKSWLKANGGYSSKEEYINNNAAYVAAQSKLEWAKTHGTESDIEDAMNNISAVKSSINTVIKNGTNAKISEEIAGGPGSETYDKFIEYQTHAISNSSLYGENVVPGLDGAGNYVDAVHDSLDGTTGIRTAQQAVISDATSNEAAIEASRAQAKGAANARRHAGGGNGGGH